MPARTQNRLIAQAQSIRMVTPRRYVRTNFSNTYQLQDGGLSFGDITKGTKKVWDWSKKNKPVSKVWDFIDGVLPA